MVQSEGWLTRGGDRVSQAAIGKMAGLDPNTALQIIKGLEQKGVISREPSTDSRVKNPLLTSKGREILNLALPAVETADAHFFSKLTAQEMEQLIKVFQKLNG